MLKPLAVAALLGSLGAPSQADLLKSSTALPLDPLPAASAGQTEQPLDPEGLVFEDGLITADYDPWGADAAHLFEVHSPFGHEGGEGGEGGEGHRHHRHHKHHKHHTHGHFGAAAPALPRLRVDCGSREVVGMLLGAAGGGLLGSNIGKGRGQLAAVAAGTLLGAFIGREIGASLDQSDLACAHAATRRAHSAPIGSEIQWRNPETGHAGTIVPVREGTDRGGQYCREYQQTVTIGGRTEQAYGTACRMPDGAWQIVS